MAEKNHPSKIYCSVFFTPPRWADVAFVWRRPARMRGRPIKPHTSAQRAPRRRANGCVDMLFLRRSVNLTVTCSARRRHWGQGSPCKLRFGTKTRCLRFSCAARKAKSVVRFSFRVEDFFDFHFAQAMKSKIYALRMP